MRLYFRKHSSLHSSRNDIELAELKLPIVDDGLEPGVSASRC